MTQVDFAFYGYTDYPWLAVVAAHCVDGFERLLNLRVAVPWNVKKS